MDLRLSHTFLTVDDHDAALAFYRDVLGMSVANDVAYGGAFWLSMRNPGQPDLDIVLESPGADPNVSEDDRTAIRELLAKGLIRGVIFSCDDVDKTFELVEAAGAEVIQEPMDQPYGVRDCAFRDPAGNMLRFAQRRD